MTRIAYAAPGCGRSTAFMPLPVSDGRGCGPWSNSSNVSGQPGTQAVPAGTPDFGDQGLVVNGLPVRGGGAGYAQGSGTMKSGAWYPSVYYLRRLDGSTLTVAGQGVSIYSDNQLPVPAKTPLGRAAVLAVPPRFLGQRDIYQPAPGSGPKWPAWLHILSRGK